GGPNDADGVANGTVVDPSGVGVTSGPSAPSASTSDGGGCTLSNTQQASQRLDLLLLGTLLAWFGVRKARQQ
ncbi:MAG: hypothetical protein KKA36_05085, partial [Gammaproteobacteria bacterium]|nr:hypothetical protein [Gammaproteobacteria bacterium]